MNNSQHNWVRQSEGGYVALMATIIIGAILLIATIDLGMQGAAVRFSLLGLENREQAKTLAMSCVDRASAQLLQDVRYRGHATTSWPQGTCYVFPFVIDNPDPGLVTFRVQARVDSVVSNLEVVKRFTNINVSLVPLVNSPAVPGETSVEVISSTEVPTLP